MIQILGILKAIIPANAYWDGFKNTQQVDQATNNMISAQGAFASPTDNMLSPCSQKLNAHKNRFFAK